MAFAASDGSFLFFNMTALALFVVGHHEARLCALGLKGMAFRTGPILRALPLNDLSVFINVMTYGTIFQGGLCIVVVMVKSTDRTFQFPKSINL